MLSESGVQGRLDVARTRGLTPLVGREQEVGLLLDRWEQVKNGQGQVVLLSGEAGIGKSRLIQVLREQVAKASHMRLECRSSPYYANTALYPIIDSLHRTLRIQATDLTEEKLQKLETALGQYRLPLDEAVLLMATLLSIAVPEGRYAPLNLTPELQRQRTLETLLAILLELADRQPLLFILEDLHWTDPTTLELLGQVIDQIPTASVLLLLTSRPEFNSPWSSRSFFTQVMVNRLSPWQIQQLAVKAGGGKAFPAALVEQFVQRTDGVPLYIEEMTKAVLESGVLKEADDQYELVEPLTALAIPTTIQDSLMARLDRLVTAKAVAQYAAVIGRQFSYALLQAISPLDEATLQHELSQLVEVELLYQRGIPPQAIYTFKHALISDTAYQCLLRRTRQGYHHRIADVLTERFPEIASTQPELIAYHFTEAGRNAEAIDYWQQAGEGAGKRSAYAEAIGHLTKGLETLKKLPDSSERDRRELNLQIALGPALMAIKGYPSPEVGHTYARARFLCQQVGETLQQSTVLYGLWAFHHTRAELRDGREAAEALLDLSRHSEDPALLAQAHRTLGATLFYMGEINAAQTHVKHGLSRYQAQLHHARAFRLGQDQGVACLCILGLAQWLRGYPEQALQAINEALTIAQEMTHPHSLAHVLMFSAWLHQLRREAKAAQLQAEAAIALADAQTFPFYGALSEMLQGWAQVMQGRGEDALTQMRQGLATCHEIGNKVSQPSCLVWLAEAYGEHGCPESGLSVLTKAQTMMAATEVGFYESELYGLKGSLRLRQTTPNVAEAEADFHQALVVARAQQAHSWELRAATSLASLWQSQGKRQEARELLAPIYGWFTEGFDTADLKDAKALLDELDA